MQSEESYVWATIYAAVCAAHGREAAVKEADKGLEVYRKRVEDEREICLRCTGTGVYEHGSTKGETCGNCNGTGKVGRGRW